MSDIVTVELYGGKYVIEFNKAAHRYRVRGIDAYPDGVTSISKAAAPFQGDDWGARVGVDHVRQGYMAYLEANSELIEQSAFLALCEEAETAHQRIRNTAGDRGSQAHDIIEKILTGQTYEVPDNPIVLASLKAFKRWRETDVCEVLEAERIVFHDDLFYCGTADIYGLWNGNPAIVDFKTGSGFYDDMPYQLAGYAAALEREFPGLHIDEGYVVHLDKQTSNYRTYPVKINDGMREAWANAVLHYKSLKKVKEMVKEIKNGLRSAA